MSLMLKLTLKPTLKLTLGDRNQRMVTSVFFLLLYKHMIFVPKKFRGLTAAIYLITTTTINVNSAAVQRRRRFFSKVCKYFVVFF